VVHIGGIAAANQAVAVVARVAAAMPGCVRRFGKEKTRISLK